MNRIWIKIGYCILVLSFLSCGPKKGIVTKKKHQKERVDDYPYAVKKSSSSSSKEESIEDGTETSVVAEMPKTSRVPKSNSAIDIYIANFADIAIVEMRKFHIPASITLAQGILESGSGNGRLAVEANNHFGIKCHDWKGERIYHDDDLKQECFRKYKDPRQSYEDHSKFLTQRSRYASLFSLKEDDYKAWAKGLKKAGYATDRHYPKKLIHLIEAHDLHEFDEEVLGKKSRRRASKSDKQQEEHIASSETYIVKAGDTLYSLSRKFGLSVDEIKSINGLSDNNISVGQSLKLK